MSVPSAAERRRSRRMLIGIALLFFGPLGVAFYLYYGPTGWRPPGHVNHGDLIDPPRPLPALGLPLAGDSANTTTPDFLRGKWTLLYRGPGTCNARCRTDLYNMRQVRIALNRDMERVQRVFIAEGACCDFDYLHVQQPDLITVQATPAAAPLLALLSSGARSGAAGSAIPDTDRIYLIDPLGNLMMSYAAEANPKGMLQDLKRLLGLSHVG